MAARALKVLVLGAGELGMSVLGSFAERQVAQVQVSVLLRTATINSTDPGKTRNLNQLRDWGIYFVAGDIATASVDTLASLFAPFHLVISCTGFSAGRGTQVKIAEAVLAAGVPKFVPWQFGVDYDRIGFGSAQDLFDEQLRVRQLLRSQANHTTAFLIVSTGIFCSFLFEPWFGIVESTATDQVTVRALGSWENAVTVTAVEDIGSLTVAITTSPSTEWNRVVCVAGDTITYKELADIMRQLLGDQQVLTEEWTVDALRRELAADPTNEIKKYRVVFAQGVGVSWEMSTTWNATHGAKATSVCEWIETRPEILYM